MAAPKGTRPPAAGRGRKKGTPNRLSGAVKDMILQALDELGGVVYLVKQATENPTAFLTLVGKVLPMQVTGQDDGGIKHSIEVRYVRAPPQRGSQS